MRLNIFKKIQGTRKIILFLRNFNPATVIITGLGLGEITKQFTIRKTIKYSNIPYSHKTTVHGHTGELFLSSYNNIDLLIFNRRFHYYEGFCPQKFVYPIRVMKFFLGGGVGWGLIHFILTAAVGELNKKYFTGDYDSILRRKTFCFAKKFNITVHESVYFCVFRSIV